MLYASSFLGFLAIIPAFEGTYEVAGNAAKTLEAKLAICFVATTTWADIAFDASGEPTNWVAIDWVVYGAITDASFFHMTNNCLEGLDIVGRITIHFDVGNMTSVT